MISTKHVFKFNDFKEKYLRTIKYSVVIVTDHMTSNKHDHSRKIGQISMMTHYKKKLSSGSHNFK